jgi:uncharacterized protein (TIGR00369 family)
MDPRAQEMLEHGRRVLAQQPFSTLLGAELLAFAPGYAELRVAIKDELKQQHGFVHGGVVSYLADNALTYAGGSVLLTGVVTSEYKINYVRPAVGRALIARATAAHTGRNQAVCRCDVFVESETGEQLCAIAQGTIVRLGEAKSASSGTSGASE